MANRKKSLLDISHPLRETNDILYRGMVGNIPIVQENAVERLPFLKRWSSKVLMDLLGAHYIEKSRQPIPSFTLDKGVKIRTTDYNYADLMQLSKTHWLLRQIFRAIIGEVINPRWEIEPRFMNKCKQCGKEYDKPEVEKCEICQGTDFDKPDWKQYAKLDKLLKNPGQSRTFVEFVRSSLWYDLALDDFYWEIGYTREFSVEEKKVVHIPQTVRVLDGAKTFPVQDEYGTFNSPEYFCRTCYTAQFKKTGRDTSWDIRSTQHQDPKQMICPDCNEQLSQTAFIQKNASGEIIARWTEEEVIHSSSSRVDPEPFGMSKIVGCLKHLLIIDFMDEYDLQTFSKGFVDKIIGIPGADKTQIEGIQKIVLNQLAAQTQIDSQTGEPRQSLERVIIFIGLEQAGKPEVITLMPTENELRSIEKYRLRVEKVSGVFGVTPLFTNTAEPEAGGTVARPRIDVQNRVTKGYMRDVEDPFNDQLLPRLKITDWVIHFGKIESRDMLREARIKQTISMTVATYENQGFDVEVSEDGLNFTTSTKRVRDPVANSRFREGKKPQERTMPGGDRLGIPIEEPEVSVDDKT